MSSLLRLEQHQRLCCTHYLPQGEDLAPFLLFHIHQLSKENILKCGSKAN